MEIMESFIKFASIGTHVFDVVAPHGLLILFTTTFKCVSGPKPYSGPPPRVFKKKLIA
jgi:hypothetical protein